MTLKLFDKPGGFKTAREHYGIWPTTVWNCLYSDEVMQALKRDIGDGGSARKGSALEHVKYKHVFDVVEARKILNDMEDSGANINTRQGVLDPRKEIGDSVYGGKITESIFNPQVAIHILNLYGPKPEKDYLVYDPFGGGGARGIIAADFGYWYVGVEIRKEEIDAVMARAKANDVEFDMIHGNSQSVPEMEDASADFLYTCPPYWNLEMYQGGEGDLSMASSYGQYFQQMGKVVLESYRILKPGAISCWVVGLHRDSKANLIPLHHDIASIHRQVGFKMKEEIIINMQHTGALQRVGNFDRGNRLLVRMHEYCLVFVR